MGRMQLDQPKRRAFLALLSDVVLIGISNQGLFMPLVVAARPIRRVMINAVVPVSGKSFKEAFDFQEVFATWIAHMLARRAPGLSSRSVSAQRIA